MSVDNSPERQGVPLFRFQDFEFKPDVGIAESIYQGRSQQVTERGCVVSGEATADLRRFASDYAGFLGIPWQPYLRVDIYPSTKGLAVLEVNTAFVDGWGIALNLSRAIGEATETDGLFPDRFGLVEEQYRPELTLLLGELAVRGQVKTSLETREEPSSQEGAPIYVYGRLATTEPLVLPRNGRALDDKRLLARFSRAWNGQAVYVPETFTAEAGNDWQDIPPDVYLKFVDKSSEAAQAARFSVQAGKPQGKAPFLRRAYQAGKLIAQREVRPWQEIVNGLSRTVQLVVLTKGDFMTGYVQYGRGPIINDNSIHGPLQFEKQEQDLV